MTMKTSSSASAAAPGTGHGQEGGTLLLTLLAAATFGVARSESDPSPATVAVLTAASAIVPIGFWLALRFWGAGRRGLGRLLPLAVLTWSLLPLLVEWTLRQSGRGSAFEMTMLAALASAALMASAYSHRPRCRQMAGLLAASLILFAVVIATSPIAFAFAGIYGVAALWWLMARYWERLHQAKIASNVERCLPARTWVLGASTAALMLVATALVAVDADSTYVLPGFMPTSGGNRWSDEYARAGVGDGSALVAAKEHALSFGPVESELFLDSEMPTLYDMFDETYGEPPKRKKTQERSIGLAPNVQERTQRSIVKSQESGREFSTLRTRAHTTPRNLEDRPAPALLYAVGRMPLHLALERYDSFDGVVWSQSHVNERHPQFHLKMESTRPWMHVQRPGPSPIHRGTHSHAIKIINLKTNRIPSPPQFAAVHIDKVDQTDFFAWTHDGVAYLPVREYIPQLTVVHLRSFGVNLSSVRTFDFTAKSPTHVTGSHGTESNARPSAVDAWAEALSRYLHHDSVSEHVTATVHEWTNEIPRGWRQVEAVVHRLRSEFIHDAAASLPEDCTDAAAHFLRQRSGPDYLFATTAAMMLRSLGYHTRLVGGFYARPERFDRRAGQTEVLEEDVHVWAEVRVDRFSWVTIEPTPGFDPPGESLTWRQRAAQAAGYLVKFVASHAHVLLLLGVLSGVLWASRITTCEAFAWLLCRLGGVGSSTRRVRWTMRLLEWRSRLARRSRPPCETTTRWYGRLGAALSAEASGELDTFLRLAERTLYAPEKTLRWSDNELRDVRRVCRTVTKALDVRCLRRIDK
jgi:hypothetical protein